MRGLAEREGLLNECGEVGELTEKEWDVDFEGRPYNGNLVCGTLLRGGGSSACGSVGDGLPIRSAVQGSSGSGPHVVWESGRKRSWGEASGGFVLALRKRS